MRRAVSPEREVLNQLTNRENPLIDAETLIYFRDVYDHLIRITDELDTHRELLSGALDAYLSTVNNTLSDVMKRLTAVTAVLAGVGAVAGIFGMSEAAHAFDLRAGLGFWLVTGLVRDRWVSSSPGTSGGSTGSEGRRRARVRGCRSRRAAAPGSGLLARRVADVVRLGEHLELGHGAPRVPRSSGG